MKHLWRNAWLLLAAILLLLTVALAADSAEVENPNSPVFAQDVSQQLPQVTGLRMLTETEEITVTSAYEGQITRTLYPGSLVWDPVEGDVSYMVRYYREIDGDRAVQIDQIRTEDAFLPVDLLWTPLKQGTYYATVTVGPNSAGYLPSDPLESGRWTLDATPSALPVPTVTVTGPLATVSGDTNNVARYNLQVLVRDSETEVITLLLDLSDPTYSIDEYLVEENPGIEFSVRAQAVALDPTKNTNSAWSSAVPIDTPERLKTPANVRFITTPTTIEVDLGNGAFYEETIYPGAIVWDAVEGAENYFVTIYRDGAEYKHDTTVSSFCDQWWRPWEQLPNGTYTAQVWAECYDGTKLPSEAAEAAPWVYTQPAMKLEKPSNLRWEGVKAVTDPVANAENYYFVLYYSPTADGTFTAYPAHYREQSNVYDFSDQIQELGNGYYYFQVTAYCDDVTTAVASPMSDASKTLHIDWEKLPTPGNFHMAQTTETVTYTENGEPKKVTVYPGFLTWNPVDGASNYLLTFYPEGEDYYTAYSYVDEPCWKAFEEGIMVADVPYKITLQAVGEAGKSMTSDEAEITCTYTVPDEKLPAPTVTQEGGIIRITDEDEDAVYNHRVEIFKGTDRGNLFPCHSEDFKGDTFAIPDYIQEALDNEENYYVQVRSRSNNLLTTADSGWSQLVWLTKPESAKETISQVEQIVMALPEDAGLSAVQEKLGEINSGKLLTALEEKPAETAAQIAALEEKVNITVTVKDEGNETSDVQVVGLGLSAADASTPVTLTVTQTPSAALQLLDAPAMTGANFRSATDVKFEATNVKSTLVVPVQISLPVPAEDSDQLRLYQGSEEVPFVVDTSGETTYVRFAVSDLSKTYVLAEANPLGEVTVDDNGTVTVTANAPDGTTLYAASYDESGKMLDVATASVTADETSYTLTLTSAGASVRVFLLDQNQMPLCEAKTIKIS